MPYLHRGSGRWVESRAPRFYLDLTKTHLSPHQRNRVCSNICAINTCQAAVWGKCDASRATTFRPRRFVWKIGPWVISRQMYAVLNLLYHIEEGAGVGR